MMRRVYRYQRLSTTAGVVAASGAADADGLIEEERAQPVRPRAVEADLTVPLWQAITTAALAMLASTVAAWLWDWDWRLPLIVGAAVLLLAWLWRMGAADQLLWLIERQTGRDLDDDRQVGRPESTPAPGLLAVNPAAAQNTAATLQRDAAQRERLAALLAFVRRCAVVGTGESALRILPRDRGAYLEMRDTLMTIGAARWRDPERRARGWELAVSPADAVTLVKRHVLAK